MEFKSSFRLNATLIPNEFIDTYMASANGEYIKEYLFLLRHDGEAVTVSMIADAVNHTESDVTRALTYWKKAGVLEESVDNAAANGKRVDNYPASDQMACAGSVISKQPAVSSFGAFSEAYAGITPSVAYVNGETNGAADGIFAADKNPVPEKRPAFSGSMAMTSGSRPASSGTLSSTAGTIPTAPTAPSAPVKKAEPRPLYSQEQISGLAGDEDFSQLLYIAQKYMNKVFTQRECEVFAYLYDGLHMTAELLEYVVEYCVQGGHTSIRYIETVAINWHESGLKTVDDAKAYASSFTKDSFAVMRAFGLNDRKPGDTEREMIDRWFRNYGFTRELVLEACNRTMEATHSPSFKYADKILSGWKKSGVRTLEDVKRLDEQHAGRAKGKSTGSQDYKAAGGRGRNTNQFQNFPQREIDYDALVLQQLTDN